jgi:hypothetical protein
MQQKLVDSEVVPGRILWLPRASKLPAGSVRSLRSAHPLDPSGYEHPIVVCSRPAEPRSTVHFHVVCSGPTLGVENHTNILSKITTFGGKSLEEKFFSECNYDRISRLNYLPIVPSSRHPASDHKKSELPSLTLVNDRQLALNSYVHARDVFSIDWRLLEPYPRATFYSSPEIFALDYQSLNLLLSSARELSGYLPGPQAMFEEKPVIKLPTPVAAGSWQSPPMQMSPYPSIPEDFSESKIRQQRPRLSEAQTRRPTLSLSIPGEMDYGSISKHPPPVTEAPSSRNMVDECFCSCSTQITSIAGKTGNSIANAWKRWKGGYGKLDSS